MLGSKLSTATQPWETIACLASPLKVSILEGSYVYEGPAQLILHTIGSDNFFASNNVVDRVGFVLRGEIVDKLNPFDLVNDAMTKMSDIFTEIETMLF